MLSRLLGLIPTGPKRCFFATMGHYPLLADVWYLLTGGFRSEHGACMATYHAYRYGKDLEPRFYEFIVRTHGLEKGFVMPNRRGVWAVRYLPIILDHYEVILHDLRPEWKDTLVWGTCVLQSYFDTVDIIPETESAKRRFEAIKLPLELDQQGRSPIPLPKVPPPFGIEQLLELSRSRYSVRLFDVHPVGRRVIDRALEVARESPSACNRQGYQFYIADTPEMAQELGGLALGGKGIHHQFPGLAVVVGKQVAYPFLRDRHSMYIDSSLASMGFIYGLQCQGVGACCLAWPMLDRLDKAMREKLGLKAVERPLMLIAFGYPLEGAMAPYSQKQSLQQIRRYLMPSTRSEL